MHPFINALFSENSGNYMEAKTSERVLERITKLMGLMKHFKLKRVEDERCNCLGMLPGA